MNKFPLTLEMKVTDLPNGLSIEVEDLVGHLSQRIYDFGEAHVKRRLIELGWTPPIDVEVHRGRVTGLPMIDGRYAPEEATAKLAEAILKARGQ